MRGFFRTAGRTALKLAATLADAVADVAHGVEAAHILLLEEVDRIGIAFRKQRDQHVRPGNRILAGRLDVQNGALDHPLETGRGLGIAVVLGLQGLIFLVEVLAHNFSKFAQIDPASGHHFGRVRILDQCEQQMLERCIFMRAIGCSLERIVKRLFETLGETGHSGVFRW